MITLPNPSLNAAIMTMARKVWRLGYDVSDHDSYSMSPGMPGSRWTSKEAYFAEISERRRVTIYTGGSNNTIFGFKELNWDFRAWHEWTHFTLRAGFNLDGELAVAHRQCQDLALIYGHEERTVDWQQIIMAEVYGQGLYYDRYDEFVRDQLAFTNAYLRHGTAALDYRC